MAIDIFNPSVSVVSKDMAGKTILVYGSNRTGKSRVATELPKPFYLPFEMGINGRAGIPFVPITKWSDFLKIVKQLTKQDTLAQVQEMYQTIIFDTIEAAARYCEEYTCEKYGAETIASGNRSFGLWKELSTEIWRPINQLTSVGYTVYFIAHDGTREFKDENGEEYTKIYPRGEKRMVDPVCDLVDVIAFVQPNGLDEAGKEIKSSAFFTNTRKYHAGTRFDYFQESLKEFTAEGLQGAFKNAVELQEKAEGIKAVGYSEQKATQKTEQKSFSDVVSQIKDIAKTMGTGGRLDEYKSIVEKYLGKDGSVKDATDKQLQQLEMILDDLKDVN